MTETTPFSFTTETEQYASISYFDITYSDTNSSGSISPTSAAPFNTSYGFEERERENTAYVAIPHMICDTTSKSPVERLDFRTRTKFSRKTSRNDFFGTETANNERNLNMGSYISPHMSIFFRDNVFSSQTETNADEKKSDEDIATENNTDDSKLQDLTIGSLRISSIKVTGSSKPKSTWCYNEYGDVDIAEICYDSVNGECVNETSGCSRLHCFRYYHWQMQNSEGKWLNLCSEQVEMLECQYCDVQIDTFLLPSFNPSLPRDEQNSVYVLLGNLRWIVDFNTMKLKHPENESVFSIRRLCTEQRKGIDIRANQMEWYFLKSKNMWVKYDYTDATLNNPIKSPLTSELIERLYTQMSNTEVQFHAEAYLFKIFFFSMTEKNTRTNSCRKVRRRPVVHIQLKFENCSNFLPKNWSFMTPTDMCKSLVVFPCSEEYLEIFNLLEKKKFNVDTIIRVERIQNSFLWKTFQDRLREVAALSNIKVNIQQLFHGTTENAVKGICEENFDPKRNEANVRNTFDRGTYFASNPNIAAFYCKPNSVGYKFMFIARVLVGTCVAGRSDNERPSLNLETNVLFNYRTKSRPKKTEVIVKYDQHDYYPEYLLVYK